MGLLLDYARCGIPRMYLPRIALGRIIHLKNMTHFTSVLSVYRCFRVSDDRLTYSIHETEDM